MKTAEAIIEKSMLFSGQMVRALLYGSKTQTRRVVKPQPFHGEVTDTGLLIDEERVYTPPHPVGSLIWAKETFSPWSDDFTKRVVKSKDACVYRADFKSGCTSLELGGCEHWKPSIFMPRKFSRITLEVTAVKVERLQDISVDDAWAEGIGVLPGVGHVEHYRLIWEDINGKKHPWSSNPWVWCYTFKRIKP